jgi:hypothetical protein
MATIATKDDLMYDYISARAKLNELQDEIRQNFKEDFGLTSSISMGDVLVIGCTAQAKREAKK